MVALLADLPAPDFVIDGELVIEVAGNLSFDALQMRLHPAESRIRKLSRETQSRFIAFDMLVDTDGTKILGPAHIVPAATDNIPAPKGQFMHDLQEF